MDAPAVIWPSGIDLRSHGLSIDCDLTRIALARGIAADAAVVNQGNLIGCKIDLSATAAA